jgi:flagellar hook-length control protein FliK
MNTTLSIGASSSSTQTVESGQAGAATGKARTGDNAAPEAQNNPFAAALHDADHPEGGAADRNSDGRQNDGDAPNTRGKQGHHRTRAEPGQFGTPLPLNGNPPPSGLPVMPPTAGAPGEIGSSDTALPLAAIAAAGSSASDAGSAMATAMSAATAALRAERGRPESPDAATGIATGAGELPADGTASPAEASARAETSAARLASSAATDEAAASAAAASAAAAAAAAKVTAASVAPAGSDAGTAGAATTQPPASVASVPAYGVAPADANGILGASMQAAATAAAGATVPAAAAGRMAGTDTAASPADSATALAAAKPKVLTRSLLLNADGHADTGAKSAIPASPTQVIAAAQAMANADRHGRGSDPDAANDALTIDAGAGAAQVHANALADTRSDAATPALKIQPGQGYADFSQALSARVSWLVDKNLNGAKLQVSPPDLGPIDVRIAVQGNHAQIWFSAHSAVTRAALESSSSGLRDLLGTQGFGQVSVDISQHSFQERTAYTQPYEWAAATDRGSAAAAPIAVTGGSSPRAAPGAIDAYA